MTKTMNEILVQRAALFIPQRTRLHHFSSRALKIRDARLAQYKRFFCGALCIKYELIDFSLPRSELTRSGKRPRDVRGVIAIFGGRIDNNQFARLDTLAILIVMKNCPVDSGGNDRRIARSLRTHSRPHSLQRCLGFVFIRSRLYCAYDFAMTRQRNVDGLLQDLEFRGGFDLAHFGYDL